MAQTIYSIALFNTIYKNNPRVKKLKKKDKIKLEQDSNFLNSLNLSISLSNIIRHCINIKLIINIYIAPVMSSSYY